MTQRKKRLAWLALVVVVFVAARLSLPYLLRWTPVRRVLLARLEYAFGRPVQVDGFDVSLVRPRLQAIGITVAEDPRFGQEFFLGADSLSAGLDWAALLHGHLRFVRFTFTRPHLNVVVAADGAWNVETWLESRASAGNAAARGAGTSGRPRQIVVNAGRINFKRGADKQPFALVEVDGTLVPRDRGMWSMDFEARLLRAGVSLQEAGTVGFHGQLPEAGALPALEPGATTQQASPPAQFDLAWQRASLSDALRLLTGQDFGVRGSLEGSLSVRGPAATAAMTPTRTPGAGAPSADESAVFLSSGLGAGLLRWTFHGDLRLSGIHRWDFPLRPDHPAVNLTVEGAVAADRSLWELSKVTLDAPRSNLRANGVFARDSPEKTRFRFLSSSVHFDDLFAWYRAFHAGVADGVALDGFLGVDVETAGWPLRIERGVLATDGVRVTVPGVNKQWQLSHAALRATPQRAELSSVVLAMGDAGGSFRLTAKSPPKPGTPWQVLLSGDTERVEELFAAAVALGLESAKAWQARGTMHANLRANLHWQGIGQPWSAAPSGTVDLEAAELRSGALALPVQLARAHLELGAAGRRIRFSGAKFLGGEWSGTMHATPPSWTLPIAPAGPWDFVIEVSRLDTAEFDRWFAASPGVTRGSPIEDGQNAMRFAWPDAFEAHGRITVGEFAVGRLRMKNVKAKMSLADHSVEISPGDADFFGGKVHGNFRAAFDATPSYDVDAQFDRVDLAALTTVGRTFADCCAGKMSGRIQLTASGAGLDGLLESLKGEGTANLAGAELRTLDLAQSREAGTSKTGSTAFRDVKAHFTVDAPEIFFDLLRLDYGGQADLVTGYVTFADALRLTLHHLDSAPGDDMAATFERVFRITGTLGAPQLAPIPLADKPR